MYIIKINNTKWPIWDAEQTPGKYIGVDSFASTPFPTNEFPCKFSNREMAEGLIKEYKNDSMFADATIEEV